MRILLKFPTRGRPAQFLTTLKGWLDNAAHPEKLSVLVSYDADDASMTPFVIQQAQAMHPSVVAVCGNSKSKIEACNSDLPEYGGDWDICLLVSDDMWSRRFGWDSMISREMELHFPDTDGSLWFFDNSQRKINTLSCLGRKFYRRFGFIYHPSYKSFFCDDEQTAVGLALKRLVFIETPICTHEHPSWGRGMKVDDTYRRNNPFWKSDEANYHARKSAGFPA